MQPSARHRLPPRWARLGRRRLLMDFWGQSIIQDDDEDMMMVKKI